jgi:hypothetical protein
MECQWLVAESDLPNEIVVTVGRDAQPMATRLERCEAQPPRLRVAAANGLVVDEHLGSRRLGR